MHMHISCLPHVHVWAWMCGCGHMRVYALPRVYAHPLVAQTREAAPILGRVEENGEDAGLRGAVEGVIENFFHEEQLTPAHMHTHAHEHTRMHTRAHSQEVRTHTRAMHRRAHVHVMQDTLNANALALTFTSGDIDSTR